MKKQEVQRVYKFSDATLVTKGLEKVAFMQRDVTEFNNYGFTADNFTALQGMINSFSNRLTDVESLGDQVGATIAKDAKAEELRTAIRNVMTRVSLNFAVGSAEYKKFGTDTLSKQTDSELLITAKRVVRVGTELMPILSAFGLTTAQLDALNTLSDEFSDLIVDMKLEIGKRDIEQEDRVEAGNEIYTAIVKFTNLGQSIWESTDVAKFNDYILYNTISGEEEDVTPPTT